MSFAEFQVQSTSELGILRKVGRFSMVMGHGRWLRGLVRPKLRAEWSCYAVVPLTHLPQLYTIATEMAVWDMPIRRLTVRPALSFGCGSLGLAR